MITNKLARGGGERWVGSIGPPNICKVKMSVVAESDLSQYPKESLVLILIET